VSKGRLEAFSDGVIAILITIMVLELRAPEGADWTALRPLAPVLISYVLSFAFLGIYWNNHHHLFQATHHVNGAVLWANLHLLFWLSLTPFVTAWMGETHFATVPVVAYGVLQLLDGFAFFILSRVLVTLHGPDSHLARALGDDYKAKASVALYAVSIGVAFVWRAGAIAIFALVAIMWLVPDPRVERALAKRAAAEPGR
jgi:uncharacterized membrane protein